MNKFGTHTGRVSSSTPVVSVGFNDKLRDKLVRELDALQYMHQADYADLEQRVVALAGNGNTKANFGYVTIGHKAYASMGQLNQTRNRAKKERRKLKGKK